nr:fungal specific transcription factor domain-containing protein [Colletotrichum truncatum]KAF6791230.1 fungal specific transcription factor domain-containing protein [Colletotrichum truncatum]
MANGVMLKSRVLKVNLFWKMDVDVYLTSNKLWTSLSDELETRTTSPPKQSSPARDGVPSTGINLIFGQQQHNFPDMLQPSAIQSFRLWQVFLSNVHPLTKIVHGPSIQEEILRVLQDPSKIEKSMECLLFSIYLIAVVSLTEQECRDVLDESREKHLARYRYATEAALSRVDFLRSTDLRVLQAFTLYLLALRHLCDNDVLWLLTGLATRMGQRMGLHRESSLKDLSPFDAEMRRRVWWQIIILDGRAAQVTGASMNPAVYLLGDTKQPANVNDADLVPSMGASPPVSPITTEMVFCSIRIDIGTWMMQQKTLPSFSAAGEGTSKFLKTIDDLENHIERKYLKNIDTNIPLNQLAFALARSAISQLRISACHPLRRPERGTNLTPEQMEGLLQNSLEVIRYDILTHTMRSMAPFLWHVSNFFPFETFVLLLGALSSCSTSQAAEAAWDVVNQVYEHHPSFIKNRNEPLHRALGNLTLKSWSQGIANARKGGLQEPAEPPCIGRLLQERSPLARTSQASSNYTASLGDSSPITPHSQGLDQMHGEISDDGVNYWSQNLPQDMSEMFFAMGGEFFNSDGMGIDSDIWQSIMGEMAPSGLDGFRQDASSCQGDESMTWFQRP